MSKYNNPHLQYNKIDSCPLCNSSVYNIVIKSVTDSFDIVNNYEGNIHRCIDCGHAFLSPILSSDQIHLAYDGYITQKFENLSSTTDARRDLFSFFKEYYNFTYNSVYTLKGVILSLLSRTIPFSKFFLCRALRYVPSSKKTEKIYILDVGCGRGDFLMRATYCGFKAVGIDIDPETAKIARLRGLDVYVSELNNFSTSTLFDVITLSHVIEHVYDPRLLLKTIYDLLAPGGYFYIATPNFNSSGRQTFSKYWRGLDVPRHMHFFNVELLNDMLVDTGFANITQVYDLPQSLGIIRSSFYLNNQKHSSKTQALKSISKLFKYKFLLLKSLDVLVIKCYKP